VTLRRRDGHTTETSARSLVSAVGQLNRPMIPTIEGQRIKAAGSLGAMASRHRPAGKRVAVIGTGATAVQLVPNWPRLPRSCTSFSGRPFGSAQRGTTTRSVRPRSGCSSTSRTTLVPVRPAVRHRRHPAEPQDRSRMAACHRSIVHNGRRRTS
jgi:cation diffusion facilitator CzcD-associated flavoprotein CzcO